MASRWVLADKTLQQFPMNQLPRKGGPQTSIWLPRVVAQRADPDASNAIDLYPAVRDV